MTLTLEPSASTEQDATPPSDSSATPPTTVVRRDAPDAIEPRRSTGTLRRTDVFASLGAAVASISLTAWLFTQVQVFQGVVGFILVAFILFLLLLCSGAALRRQ